MTASCPLRLFTKGHRFDSAPCPTPQFNTHRLMALDVVLVLCRILAVAAVEVGDATEVGRGPGWRCRVAVPVLLLLLKREVPTDTHPRVALTHIPTTAPSARTSATAPAPAPTRGCRSDRGQEVQGSCGRTTGCRRRTQGAYVCRGCHKHIYKRISDVKFEVKASCNATSHTLLTNSLRDEGLQHTCTLAHSHTRTLAHSHTRTLAQLVTHLPPDMCQTCPSRGQGTRCWPS